VHYFTSDHGGRHDILNINDKNMIVIRLYYLCNYLMIKFDDLFVSKIS